MIGKRWVGNYAAKSVKGRMFLSYIVNMDQLDEMCKNGIMMS